MAIENFMCNLHSSYVAKLWFEHVTPGLKSDDKFEATETGYHKSG